jgi:hypothetical protein
MHAAMNDSAQALTDDRKLEENNQSVQLVVKKA